MSEGPEHPSRRSLQRTLLALAVVAVTLLGLSFVVGRLGLGFAGRTRLSPTPPGSKGDNRGQAEDMPAIAELLKRDASLKACRNVVQQLNGWQSRASSDASATVDEPTKALLQDRFLLTSDELAEVASSTFTPLDAHHLDQCFLFADAARSLNLESKSRGERVAAAFAWAMRQVRLQAGEGPPSPPAAVLRRGWGTGHERALVFLALLEQLEIPGYVLVVPGKGENGDFPWIIGALVDGKLLLFDPRLGLPLPGPEGSTIATWNDVRTKPEWLAQWWKSAYPEPRLPEDITPELAARAEPRIAVSLGMLSPRMRLFQDQLVQMGGVPRVRLSTNPATLLQTGDDTLGGPIKVWNAPGDSTTLTRSLRTFLPQEEGGTDRTRLARRRFELSLTPWQSLPPQVRALPDNVDPGRRLRRVFEGPFLTFCQEPRLPRDLLLRGRFEEATTRLVETLDGVQQQKTLLQTETDLDAKVEQWSLAARKAQADYLIAEREASRNPAGQPALKAAEVRLNDLWQKADPVMVLVLGAVADPLGADSTYQLALCKHEQAVRAQARAGQKEPVPEWKSACEWWRKYLENHPGTPAEAQARLLSARAHAALGDRTTARAMLEHWPAQASPWEKRTGALESARIQEP